MRYFFKPNNIDKNFRINSSNDIKERNEIFSSPSVIVESANIKLKKKDLQVAVKSFRRELLKSNEDLMDQINLVKISEIEKSNCLVVARMEEDYFKNEIITYQILKKKEKKCSNEKEREKLYCFVDYIGFIMSDNNNDPFVGSILTKFYPLGNLSEYTRINPESRNQFSDVSCLDQRTKPLEIEQLVDFAGQIATGFNFIYNIPVAKS